MSSRPDCIFEIHQLWQSGSSRVYSNCCCSCSFEAEIIKIGQSSHKMYSNNILNFQESMTILNACTKKVWKLIEGITYTLEYLPMVWETGVQSQVELYQRLGKSYLMPPCLTSSIIRYRSRVSGAIQGKESCSFYTSV